METLDLHQVSHVNASIIIEDFIIKNYRELPIEIITGNSVDMQNILKEIIEKNLIFFMFHPFYVSGLVPCYMYLRELFKIGFEKTLMISVYSSHYARPWSLNY